MPTATQTNAGVANLDDWRGYFTDPVLGHLIEVSLANNRDLRAATLRVQEARALYGIQFAERLPSVDGTASYSRGRTVDPMLGENVVASQYRAALGVTSFELDLFGRVKSLSDAALAEYFVSEEAQRAAQISLIAEVASAYVAQRALYDQEQLAQRTLEAREGIRYTYQAPLRRGHEHRHRIAHGRDAGPIGARVRRPRWRANAPRPQAHCSCCWATSRWMCRARRPCSMI